jgi:DNA-binding transcriptional MerR regulator
MGQDAETSRLTFINELLNNGVSINVLKKAKHHSSAHHGAILCRLNSKKVFEYSKIMAPDLSEELKELKNIASTFVDTGVRGETVTNYNIISEGAIRR